MNRKSEFSFDKSGWAVLALLRFFLAFIVLIGHLHNYQPPSQYPFSSIFELGAKAAVLGFLVISGFSIGYSYFKSKEGYFKRRFLRIYPLYFFAILATMVVQHILGSPYAPLNMFAAGWKTSVGNIFLLQNFFVIPIPYNGVVWSLSIEVFLYLLVPILFRLHTAVIVLLICISLFAYNFLHIEVMYGYPVIVFAWPWLIGFLISTKRNLFVALPLIILGGVAVVLNKERTVESLSIVTYMIVVAGLFFCLLYQFKLPSKVLQIFNYLGELSYPIYLFHIPIFLLFFYLGVRNPYVFLLLLAIAIIPINYIFDKWMKKVFWEPLVAFLGQRKSTLLEQKSKTDGILLNSKTKL